MVCGNILLADRFKCPYDTKHLACKKIDWWLCREYQLDNRLETAVIDDAGASG
jgi:hypothetical protein